MKRYLRKTIAMLMAVLICFTGCSKEDNQAQQQEKAEALQRDITDTYYLDADTKEAIVDDVKHSGEFVLTETDNDRVFYEIFVGSFSDSNGDGIGDLRGIINRFDYLNDGDPFSGKSLGVEGIWLSPVFESPSYHKYDVTDYYKIDPQFGTMEDLKELVALCRERNVKLILDLVINHTGNRNQWFIDFCNARRNNDTESEYYDFYTVNNSIRMQTRTFYQVQGCEGVFYEGNFSSDMPELNFDNPLVREKTLEIARYYLEEIGVSGFRFDAAKYIYYGEETKNVEFWTEYMNELRKIKPEIYAVAEVWDSDSLTKKYAPAIDCFNFTMAQVEGLIAQTTKRGDVNKLTHYVETYLKTVKEYNNDARIVPFISNHDMDRAAGFMTVITGFAKMAANLYILGPGSPFIYYGEEIGLKGSRGSASTDANRRLAMLWGDGDTVTNPTGTTFEASKQTNGTVESQKSVGDSLLNYYKKLIMLRKAYPEIARGEYKALVLPDTRLGGFISNYNGSEVGVFHNTTGSTITYDISNATEKRFETVEAYIGVGSASLEGTVLTIDEQTTVILK